MATSTPTLTEAELAYIAAVINTRARIKKLTLKTGTVIPVVHLSTPDMELLQYLGGLTGITPFLTHRSYQKHRCNEHCPDKHEHVESQSSRWSISGAKATILLSAIQPYVRFQTAVVNEVVDLGLDASHKPGTVSRMAELGWPLPDDWADSTSA